MEQSKEFLKNVIKHQEKKVVELKSQLQAEKDQNQWLADVANRWMQNCIKESTRNAELVRLVNRYKSEVEELGARLDQYE